MFEFYGVYMNISQAAAACGLSTKTIRYYEDLGLVVPDRHKTNEYRVYSLEHIDRLRFLQRLRAADFSLEQCDELLTLYVEPERRTAAAQSLLLEKIQQVDQQLIALNAIRQTLAYMADDCDRGSFEQENNADAEAGLKSHAFMPFTLI